MALISLGDMEKRFTPGVMAQFLDDDGDGAADTAAAAEALEEASSIGAGILKDAFPTAADLEAKVLVDAALRGALCDIAMGIIGRRRPAFSSPDGKTPYAAVRVEAEKTLERIAKAERRLEAEGTTAVNAAVGVSRVTRSGDRDFVFVPNSRNPSAGGGF